MKTNTYWKGVVDANAISDGLDTGNTTLHDAMQQKLDSLQALTGLNSNDLANAIGLDMQKFVASTQTGDAQGPSAVPAHHHAGSHHHHHHAGSQLAGTAPDAAAIGSGVDAGQLQMNAGWPEAHDTAHHGGHGAHGSTAATTPDVSTSPAVIPAPNTTGDTMPANPDQTTPTDPTMPVSSGPTGLGSSPTDPQAPAATTPAPDGGAASTTPTADGGGASTTPVAGTPATDVGTGAGTGTVTPATGHMMLGVNLAGAEFGDPAAPGVYGTDYTYPTHAEVDYYASKGMDVIRLPFLAERVQSTAGGPLNADEVARIDDIVQYAGSKGMQVVLDMHDYGSVDGMLIGTSSAANAAFSDVWGKLASHFANDSNVIFGLMNEPNQQSATDWLSGANAAIDAIRQAGAKQEILVPGSYWDGAWTWTSSDNASVVGTGVKDPLHNYAFEVHQYLDSDGSGSHANVVSDTVGVQRLTDVTQWAEATGNKLFLGEFGVASDQTSLTALDSMVSYMQQHSDAWQGATYWAGGPWWGNYMYSIEPSANGTDKPQMTVLASHLGAPA